MATPDRLTVKGFGAADGSYEFEFRDLVNVNGPGALTLREQQRVKILSGYRGLEVREASSVLDPDVMVALTVILVERNGKTISPTRVWDSKMLHTGEDEVADMDAYRLCVNWHLSGLEENDPTMVDPEADGEEVDEDPEA